MRRCPSAKLFRPAVFACLLFGFQAAANATLIGSTINATLFNGAFASGPLPGPAAVIATDSAGPVDAGVEFMGFGGWWIDVGPSSVRFFTDPGFTPPGPFQPSILRSGTLFLGGFEFRDPGGLVVPGSFSAAAITSSLVGPISVDVSGSGLRLTVTPHAVAANDEINVNLNFTPASTGPAPVPTPGPLGLLATGLALMGLRRLARR